MEDLAGYPASSDWDYNDHYWNVEVVNLEQTGNSSIGGVVWDDTITGDAVYNLGDPSDHLLANIAVNLFGDGAFVQTVYTDTSGVFAFTHLPAGSYHVQVQSDVTVEFVAKDVGNDYYDSDLDAGGWTDPIPLDGKSGGEQLGGRAGGSAVQPPGGPADPNPDRWSEQRTTGGEVGEGVPGSIRTTRASRHWWPRT